jgi:hypothetical protein
MTAANPDQSERDEFAIKLSYHYWTYVTVGVHDVSPESVIQASQDDMRNYEVGRLLDTFTSVAESVEADIKRDASSDALKTLHYDAATFSHSLQVLAVVGSSIPLAVLIKAARDVLIKLLDRRTSITVKLGDKREISVATVAELEAVLQRLDKSEFATGKKPEAPPKSR